MRRQQNNMEGNDARTPLLLKEVPERNIRRPVSDEVACGLGSPSAVGFAQTVGLGAGRGVDALGLSLSWWPEPTFSWKEQPWRSTSTGSCSSAVSRICGVDMESDEWQGSDCLIGGAVCGIRVKTCFSSRGTAQKRAVLSSSAVWRPG